MKRPSSQAAAVGRASRSEKKLPAPAFRTRTTLPAEAESLAENDPYSLVARQSADSLVPREGSAVSDR
jgi:hypothetical protein